MNFAQGMEQALALEGTFNNPAEAAGYWSAGGPEVKTCEPSYTGAAGQEQRMRLYRGGDSSAPTLLYIHGGGWTGGSIELHDRSARILATEAPCNVISISYRLSPEHPYPAGLQDTLAATNWIQREGKNYSINTDQIAIGGASAGANLAVAAALQSLGLFSHLLLFYGVFGFDFNTESYLRYQNGPGLTRARMKTLFQLYDPNGLAAHEPSITPLLSDQLGRLPPSSIFAAEHDVLLSENRALHEALLSAGADSMFHLEPGVTHGYINRGRLVPTADASARKAARQLAHPGLTEKPR